MEKRNSNIDAVKGLGILLVVLGHNWLALHDRGLLFRLIFSFHMPLFFFLSGIFLGENDDLRRAMRSKSASLLKPYFVVLVGLGIAKYVSTKVTGSDDFNAESYFLGLIWSTGLTLSWPPMWFLTNLFLAVTISLFIIKAIKRANKVIVLLTITMLILLFIGIFVIRLFWRPDDFSIAAFLAGARPGLPWSIDLLPITCSFILLGYLFRTQAKSYVLKVPHFAAAACIFGGLHLVFRETIDLNYRSYGNPLVATMQAWLGIYLMFGLATLLKKMNWLHAFFSYLGSASLFILIFHFYIEGFVFVKIARLGSRHQEIAAVSSLILGIAGPMVIFELAKRQRYLAVLLLPVRRKDSPLAQSAIC